MLRLFYNKYVIIVVIIYGGIGAVLKKIFGNAQHGFAAFGFINGRIFGILPCTLAARHNKEINNTPVSAGLCFHKNAGVFLL